jgi:acetyl-CoA/propionyl-CoA carboxylase, biotin carboxylase, biotin carboxyl carrier protein
MFTKVLIANRGEIAVRIMRTLRDMNIASVAVFSEADRNAEHVAVADESVLIGPADAARSYLDISQVILAAQHTGAQAIHPGYGFLSENADFAAACEAAGIVFIGPSAQTIASMGDKIEAKHAVLALGLPVVPGFSEAGANDARLIEEASNVGLPLIIKPSAGGGGKGMRVVYSLSELPAALASARREAMSSFGDDSLLLERFIETARHVEVQVIGDQFGTVINAGDRDCSLQRRHQKVVEEAPAPNLPDSVRASMLDAAVKIAQSVNYTGVGTVEFVVDAVNPLDHFFLEMNTRLQVEHPVTEMVTGLDLVELQLRIAAAEPLPVTQNDVRVTGHAVEVRVYAEDGNHNFMPSSGRLVRYSVPENVRVDSGVRQDDVIGTNYDPLLFKVIAHADTRTDAFIRMDTALQNCVVLGVANNISVLRALVQDSQVRSADLNTGLIESLGLGQSPVHPGQHEIIGAALVLTNSLTPIHPKTPWAIADGWRVGQHAETSSTLTSGSDFSTHVTVSRDGSGFWATVDGGEPVRCSIMPCPPRKDCFSVVVNELAKSVTAVVDGNRVLVGAAGSSWELNLPAGGTHDDFTSGERSLDHVRSPMPGTVVLVEVKVGDSVTKGTVLAVVEAMKMEYSLTAPHDGIVVAISAQVGSSVAKDAILAEVGPKKMNL